MKNYTRPELSISKFLVEDIITTSAGTPNAAGAINAAIEGADVSQAKAVNVAELLK